MASELTTDLHEVIGHASGKVAEHLNGAPQNALKEQYSALEEARADLVALYFVADRKIVDLGIVDAADHEEVVLAEYEGYARNALVQLRRVREGTQIEEDHMRNRQMIVHWLMANSTAIEVRRRDGKTYYVMTDPVAFRAGVARLLADVQHIKAQGDHEAAKALFETYGVHFEPALRDEIVARVDRLNMPSYTGFVQPRLEAVTGPDGEITDVRISYPMDLTKQMLEYSGHTVLSVNRSLSPLALPINAGMRHHFLSSLLLACAMSPQTPVQREAADTFPQRIAIIAAEDARAPTPEDLARLVTSSASPDAQIQRAAIRALGRLERRDLVTTLLPRLRDASPLVRADAAFAIAQSMRGEKLPLDIAGSQVEGVLSALAGALASERDPSTVREIIRSIARLPYERAEQVSRAEILVRQVLTLSNELSIARSKQARRWGCGCRRRRRSGTAGPAPLQAVASLGRSHRQSAEPCQRAGTRSVELGGTASCRGAAGTRSRTWRGSGHPRLQPPVSR